MGGKLAVVAVVLILCIVLVGGVKVGLDALWGRFTGQGDVEIARAKADEAVALLETEREKTRGLDKQVELERARNEGYIYKATAQALTWQTRAHLALQGTNVVLLIAALIALGLLVTYILTKGVNDG